MFLFGGLYLTICDLDNFELRESLPINDNASCLGKRLTSLHKLVEPKIKMTDQFELFWYACVLLASSCSPKLKSRVLRTERTI